VWHRSIGCVAACVLAFSCGAKNGRSLTHLDCVDGTDDPGSDVGKWYDALLSFANASTPSGGVVLNLTVQ
jgi:hypothetical protein